jgi:hypothetical protein
MSRNCAEEESPKGHTKDPEVHVSEIRLKELYFGMEQQRPSNTWRMNIRYHSDRHPMYIQALLRRPIFTDFCLEVMYLEYI